MFTDTPTGSQHPLERKQLKWLLAGLLVIVVAIVVMVVIGQDRSANQSADLSMPTGQSVVSTVPTQEDVRAKLDALAEHPEGSGAAPSTGEEVRAQLDALAKTDGNVGGENIPVKPTQEDVQKQLEVLSK